MTRRRRVAGPDLFTPLLPGFEPAVEPVPPDERAADQDERDRALSPEGSFIVQAPAGSGKTGLLIQRFLVLLARVERPESVVAITFTKKAAAEMRSRVLEALADAGGPAPGDAHKRRTWTLARAVEQRSQERGWKMRDNPNRLEVRTIDSFCAGLVSRMPWLSRMGPPPAIVEDARELYREAARATIALLEDPQHGDALECLLLHLDNNVPELVSLIEAMLSRRDQWLRHLGISDDRAAQREALETGLRNVVRDALEEVCLAIPEELEPELARLAGVAASHLESGPIVACAGLQELPNGEYEDLEAWRGVAEVVLTQKGELRKRLDRNCGFPPIAKRAKQEMEGLLYRLQEHPEFIERLHALRELPPVCYDEQQWAVVDALLTLLPIAVGQLNAVFQRRGQVDFNELSLATLRALGDDLDPTELTLALDARIEHLLVDEFQDTSFSQFELLRHLTAGWGPGDGRTLFVVGDPMQSIYRFREAEVGLFLRAAREGIGPVRLQPLKLSVNFRSAGAIVEWVNQTFPAVFPNKDEVLTGSVRYSPSVANQTAAPEPAVRIHPFLEGQDRAEGERVVEIVRQARQGLDEPPRIAILVRARSHLTSILAALREAGLRYRAIEIDSLAEVVIIQDLLALTRALLHLADRVSWLAILRAPWCGLKLADLHALAGDLPDAILWDLVRDESRVARLEPGARAHLERLRAVLERAFDTRRASLRSWVEGVWIALGGPACALQPGDSESARAYFDLLEQLDEGGDVDLDALERRAGQLYAGPDPLSDESLQVMTIHKAKGLEFDVVIVPGLGRRGKQDEPKLLLWLERPAERGGDLILAPIKPAAEKKDPLYEHLRGIDRDKAKFEIARLLYVACTRAHRELHLLGHAAYKEGEGCRASSDSLLAKLWDAVQPEFAALKPPEHVDEGQTAPPRLVLQRLVDGWRMPAPPRGVAAGAAAAAAQEASERPASFRWVGDTLRHAGIVVHAMLQQIASDGLEGWDAARIAGAAPRIETALRTLGVGTAELPRAVDVVNRALQRTLADTRGRWILDRGHAEAQSECALSGIVDGELRHVRVDRTFVADGERWIVDFKTSAHEGGGLEAFLDNEAGRWRETMRGYAAVFAKADARPVRTGLYFPLLGGWREIL